MLPTIDDQRMLEMSLDSPEPSEQEMSLLILVPDLCGSQYQVQELAL